jgi:hypothetical protein
MRYMSSIFNHGQLTKQLGLYQLLTRQILFSLLAVALCLVSMLSAFAAGSGRFEIINADFRIDQGMWVVDARSGLELSGEALRALENGVALTVQYQFKVTRQRKFWPDKVIAERTQNIQLQYLSLSRRYVVRNLNTDEQISYATMFSALRQIGRMHDFSIMAAAEIDPDENHYISMRVVLNRENLPGPLQVLVFWRGDFSLESEWYRWTLK